MEAVPPAASLRPVEDRLFDALVASFRANLEEMDPEPTEEEDDVAADRQRRLESWRSQSLAWLADRQPLLCASCQTQDLVERAQERAVSHRPPASAGTGPPRVGRTASPAAAPPTKSFSLFADAPGGFAFPPPIDFDQLVDPSTSLLEQLELLQKASLDDLVQDWDELIAPILHKALLPSNNDPSSTSPSQAACLDLHIKWCEDTKSLQDLSASSMIQSSLCRHLLDYVVLSHDADRTELGPSVVNVLRALWGLWMYWMQQVYGNATAAAAPPAAGALARALLAWHTRPDCAPLRHHWRRLDPRALWARAWLATVPAPEVAPLLRVAEPGGEEPRSRAAGGDGGSLVAATWEAVRATTTSDPEHSRMYHLHLLRCLLVALRVSGFPWSDIPVTTETGEVSAPSSHNDDDRRKLVVLEAFHSFYLQTPSLGTDDIRMALDAMDTILSGCHRHHGSVVVAFAQRLPCPEGARPVIMLEGLIARYR